MQRYPKLMAQLGAEQRRLEAELQRMWSDGAKLRPLPPLCQKDTLLSPFWPFLTATELMLSPNFAPELLRTNYSSISSV